MYDGAVLATQSQQHFLARYFLGLDIDDGLAGDDELVLRYGVFDARRPPHVGGHDRHVFLVVGFIHVYAVAAVAFGDVTGNVRLHQDILFNQSLLAEQGNPNGAANIDDFAVVLEAVIRQQFAVGFRRGGDLFLVSTVYQQRELVAAQARQQIALARAPA